MNNLKLEDFKKGMKIYGTYEDGCLTIQRAEYIEDGWYIFHADNGSWNLFEIPTGGGAPELIHSCTSLSEAMEEARKLS